MKKTAVLLLPILLIAISSAAADLDAYPMPFISGGSFTAQIIVGAAATSTDVLAATDIAVSLQQRSNTRISAQMDDEFDKSKNGILIGLPCQNTAVASVLGTKECDIGLANGTGYLKLVEKDGQTFLIVTGKTAADTRKAARLLAKSGNHAFSGTEVLVTGTLDNPQAGKSEQPVQIQPETLQAGCKADADCAESEYCLAGKCKGLGCPEGTTAQGHDCISTKKTVVEKAKEAQETAQNPELTKQASTGDNATEKPSPGNHEKKPGFFIRLLSFFREIFKFK